MHLSAKLINLDYDTYRETESITSEKAVNLRKNDAFVSLSSLRNTANDCKHVN